MRRFEGKRVIVTGAARGIGKATAERLAAEGARLLLVDLRAELLESTAAELRRAGADALAFAADVAVKAQVDAMVAYAVERFGGIDVLINNAGICREASFLETSERDWDDILAVNLKGNFLVGQAVARVMAAARAGAIVNMCSTNGLVGETGFTAYNASKGGVLLLTKTMALELGPLGIRVNAVAPGYIVTPMSDTFEASSSLMTAGREKVPLQRVAQASEVAAVFAFLASEDASFVNGEVVVVDGGQLAQ